MYLHQGRLVNFFLQAKAKSKSCPPELWSQVYCTGYISLATLLYIRSISFTTKVCGVRLFVVTACILAGLREMLLLCENVQLAHFAKYENARLWAVYVGASAEYFARGGGARGKGVVYHSLCEEGYFDGPLDLGCCPDGAQGVFVHRSHASRWKRVV